MHEQHIEQEPQPEPSPRIYVASLSDYNAGRLHGDWIDAAQPVDDIYERIGDMVRRSPEPGAEEWAIHDHDGFGGLDIGEHETIDTVVWIANGLVEHGAAFAGWVHHRDRYDPDDTFEDSFVGAWDSLGDYAEQFIDDLGINDLLDRHIPDGLRHYINVDAEGLGRDMELGGDIISVDNPDGGVWIYYAN
jgi:antirestriction protein